MGRALTCEGSRNRSIRLKASALSAAGELSMTTTRPPRRAHAPHLRQHGPRIEEMVEGEARRHDGERAVR